LPQGQLLTVAFIGAVSASLVLVVGLFLVSRRRNMPPEAKEDAGQPDPFVYGSATEKRTSLRRRGTPVRVLLTEDEGSDHPDEAWVLDRSMGGLCLRIESRPIPAGTILNIRTSNAPREAPWTPIEVKSCRPIDNGWELGCQFLKTPSWSVLLLFG
jgi:hypothetical protein